MLLLLVVVLVLQDKDAAPLNQMDVLMEETYEQIITLADKVGRGHQWHMRGQQHTSKAAGITKTVVVVSVGLL